MKERKISRLTLKLCVELWVVLHARVIKLLRLILTILNGIGDKWLGNIITLEKIVLWIELNRGYKISNRLGLKINS